MLSVVTEPLSHSASREGGEVLKRSGFGGGSGNDDGILHGIVLLEGLDELSDCRTLLTNGDVDAVQLLHLILTIVPPLLVEDGVDGDGGLSGLTVTDNQFTLTTTNGDHSIDGLDTGHHGLVDGTTRQDTRGLEGGTTTLGSVDGALSVDGISESVDDTPEQLRANWDIDDLAGTLDGVAFLDETIVTEDGDTDVIGLQVQTHSTDTGRELHHLLGCRMLSVRGLAPERVTTECTLHVLKTPDTTDTVTDAYKMRLR
jgi:hypothetical protein